MSATILDGRTLAKELQTELHHDIAEFEATHGILPHLVVVQVEGDAASDRYVRGIRKLCNAVGIAFTLESFPHDVAQDTFDMSILTLSDTPTVHGVLIQMPLPASLCAERAIMHLDHSKDVDGIHPVSAGLMSQGRPALVPNTPAGGMMLLERYGIESAGKRAAVVGRSAIVGRPMAALLLQAQATVTVCHSRTRDLGAVVRECELVAVAIGRPQMITGDMLRPGCVVLDFGINVLDDGTVVGDVDFASAVEVAGAITPVPGGTGPVTNVMLVRNVLIAARNQVKKTA
jgi:methylenetetrahydrofolate dehydrogenase (NADP+) / methenyltetrahydrofolate cyclohydrolase